MLVPLHEVHETAAQPERHLFRATLDLRDERTVDPEKFRNCALFDEVRPAPATQIEVLFQWLTFFHIGAVGIRGKCCF